MEDLIVEHALLTVPFVLLVANIATSYCNVKCET